jgi:type III secretory pathway component EscU
MPGWRAAAPDQMQRQRPSGEVTRETYDQDGDTQLKKKRLTRRNFIENILFFLSLV